MRKVIFVLILMLISNVSNSAENKRSLSLTCQNFSWSDVETLVQPYMDDSLHTALVMQGQSSNYKTSEAAMQAMDESLPDVIKTMLRSIIKSNC